MYFYELVSWTLGRVSLNVKNNTASFIVRTSFLSRKPILSQIRLVGSMSILYDVALTICIHVHHGKSIETTPHVDIVIALWAVVQRLLITACFRIAGITIREKW